MQRGTGGRDEYGRNDFFGSRDPFASFGGFGRPRSLLSSFFGGADPFDDPFFTHPFGSMVRSSMFGPSIFESGGSLFGEASNDGFQEQQALQYNRPKGPVIRELSEDEDDDEEVEKTARANNDDSENHSSSSKEPYVDYPDEEMNEKNSKYMQYRNEDKNRPTQPQARTHSFQSSTVTYGGLNGAYYTSSRTRKTGSEGLAVEESKEADTTTGKATHRIARGIHDKGHSLTRNLNSDGRVDTMQTLHNLNEDELDGFEEAWKGNARQHLSGWNQGPDVIDNGNMRQSSGNRQGEQPSRVWRPPPSEQPHNSGRTKITIPIKFV